MEVFATIEGNTVAKCGETVHLEGFNQFFPSIKYLKWQKDINGKYFDINIHESKYQGTRNYLPKPMLVINDIELDDEGTYRIEFQRTTEVLHSNVHRIKILPKEDEETMTIEVHSDQRRGKYFVGEDVIMKANIRNPSTILCMTWQKETETSSYTVNTSVPEYTETDNLTNEHTLTMKNCLESDSGTYFLLAVCTNNFKVSSNRVQLEVKKGRPFVSLTQVSEAFYNECVQLKAAIRSFPKHDSVRWMKGKRYIDITQPKYEGSSDVGDSPILCINHIDGGDAARYKIKVHNEIGTTCKIKKLEVNGEEPSVKLANKSQLVTYGNTITLFATITARPAPSLIEWRKDNKIINVNDGKCVIDNSDGMSTQLSICCLDFDDNGLYTVFVRNAFGSTHDEMEITVKATNINFISGPVVVSPSAEIRFQTVYPPNSNSAKGEWFITKNNLSRKLQFEVPGYCINTFGGQPTIQTIKITSPVENGSAFQLSVETTKSNFIKVFVDDSGKFATENEANCLRFFELQSVGMEAMRKLLDSISGTFQMKWVNFERFCKQNKGKFQNLLPPNTPTSSSDLDISVIYSMFRNTINISKPTKGWGQIPGTNDIRTADDIERVRNYRNKISHANSSEMKTKDFNKSALDLISAIQRLTTNDEQLNKKMCGILNNLCCKGTELDKMMEELKTFRDKATKREEILRETEDKKDYNLENITASDKQSIPLIGRSKLYLGETATITAFLNPNISTLSRVFWQREYRGVFYTIDINDGKYTGSTLTFPTPQLYIHFIRKEDEGMYRIVVDTFNYRWHNNIELEVKKGECDEEGSTDTEIYRRIADTPDIVEAFTEVEAETGSGSEEIIRFHQVHDSNIALLHKDTIARKKNGEDLSGVCFTNRPIRIGEHIFLRIAETHAKWSSSMDFGVTNMNPSNIHLSPNENIESIRKRDRVEQINYLPDFNDVLRFTLNSDATLSLSINDIEQPNRHLKHVSVKSQVWLSFDLWGKTRAVEISSKKPKKEPWNSYFREYSFK